MGQKGRELGGGHVGNGWLLSGREIQRSHREDPVAHKRCKLPFRLTPGGGGGRSWRARSGSVIREGVREGKGWKLSAKKPFYREGPDLHLRVLKGMKCAGP